MKTSGADSAVAFSRTPNWVPLRYIAPVATLDDVVDDEE
jgi:hypothetical protein